MASGQCREQQFLAVVVMMMMMMGMRMLTRLTQQQTARDVDTGESYAGCRVTRIPSPLVDGLHSSSILRACDSDKVMMMKSTQWPRGAASPKY